MLFKNIVCSAKNLYLVRTALCNQPKSYHLSVEPQTCLQHVTASIKVTGLQPDERATITAKTKDDKGEQFFSYAHYRADHRGCIDIEQHDSHGGAYSGCLPMGLVSSLQHIEPDKKYVHFIKKDAEKPLMLRLGLLRGHLERDVSADESNVHFLESICHERHFMSEGCRKIVVREGNLRGSLFLPPGPGPFPGIVDIFGSNGGLKEVRAAQFASSGIAAFALAYFAYDDLPTVPTEFDLEYFENAVHFMLRQKEVIPDGIGAIGISKGADLVLSMATYIKDVKAVIAINGIPANVIWPMRFKNKVIPALGTNPSAAKIVDGMLMGKDCLLEIADYPETMLPLEDCDAKIMFVVCTDDQSWHTQREVHRAADRLRKLGRSNFEIVEYEGAGHNLGPPYTQFVDRFYHKVFKMLIYVGGQLNAHSRAEQLAWIKMVKFFKDNLT